MKLLLDSIIFIHPTLNFSVEGDGTISISSDIVKNLLSDDYTTVESSGLIQSINHKSDNTTFIKIDSYWTDGRVVIKNSQHFNITITD